MLMDSWIQAFVSALLCRYDKYTPGSPSPLLFAEAKCPESPAAIAKPMLRFRSVSMLKVSNEEIVDRTMQKILTLSFTQEVL